jgi:dipeptidyl aminopeptidase/acylaminoacyl peptidase
MRRARLVAVSLALLLMAVSVAGAEAQSPRPFTVDELLKVKRIVDPRLSPDGTRVAYVLTEVDQQNNTRSSHIWIVPARGGEPVRLLVSDKSEDTPRWSPDGRRIAFVSSREGGSQVWVMEATPGALPRKLTGLATEASGVKWSPDGKWLLFVSDVYPECADLACNEHKLQERETSKVKAHVFDELLFRHWTSWKDGRFSHLLLVSADGSVPPRDLTPGNSDVPPFSLGGPDDYEFSPDSKEIAFARKTDPVEATSTNSDLIVLDLTDPMATPKQITTNRAADGGPAYSPDGRFIAYRAQSRPGFEADRWQLMLFDRHSGTDRSITASLDRSADSYAWAPDSKTIYLTVEERGGIAVYLLDLAGAQPRTVLAEGSYSDVQVSADGRTLVFMRSSLKDPGEIFRARADGSGVEPITRVNAGLMASFRLSEAESVWFEGAERTPVQAWVVKPADFKPGQKYPLLYLVHGGPQNAWNNVWGYRWNPQVFASAGYVVMMPNPRGSTGFGQQFTDQISGDWGGKVFEDLMKGVDFAETLPYIDKDRIGAAGGSFGGYMVDWFLGHTTRFKALVSHSGVFDLTSMYGATEELWFPEWDLQGTPWTNPEMYDRFSPHRYAKNFKTPTLVTHGELDFRVPVGQGLELFTTLKRLGVPAKMLYFPDEGHWITKPANSALWYRTFIEWMDRWVKGK